MSDEQDDRLHRLRNDFITLTEAASIAHVHMMRGRLDTTIPDAQLNALANTLTRLITLYSMSDDWTSVRSLTAEDMRGGLIAGGGKIIKFQDGRPAIFGLVITRTSLKAALEAL